MPMIAKKRAIKKPKKKKTPTRQVLPRGPQVGFSSPRRAARKKADLEGVVNDMPASDSEEDDDLPPWNLDDPASTDGDGWDDE